MTDIPNYLPKPIVLSPGEQINYTAARLQHLIAHWQQVRKNIPLNKISEKDLQHLDTLPQKLEAQLNILTHGPQK